MGRRAKHKQAAPEPLPSIDATSPRKRKATDAKDARPQKKLKDAAVKPKNVKSKSTPKTKPVTEELSDEDAWENVKNQDEYVILHDL